MTFLGPQSWLMDKVPGPICLIFRIQFVLRWSSSSDLVFSYSTSFLRFCSGSSLNLYFYFLLDLLLWFLFGLLFRFNYTWPSPHSAFSMGFSDRYQLWLSDWSTSSLILCSILASSSLYGIPTWFSLTFFSTYSLVSLLLFGLICRVLALALFLGFPVVFTSWPSKLYLLLFCLPWLSPLWSSAQLPPRPFICFCSVSINYTCLDVQLVLWSLTLFLLP